MRSSTDLTPRERTDDLVIDLTDGTGPRSLRPAGAPTAPPATPATRTAARGLGDRRLQTLLALAAALTLLDAGATWAWLGAGHGEWNPLLDRLIGMIGAGPAMAVRAAAGLGLLGALAVLLPRTRLAGRGLVLVTLALAAVGAYHGYGLVAHVLLV
jgi:hypothetical protein